MVQRSPATSSNESRTSAVVPWPGCLSEHRRDDRAEHVDDEAGGLRLSASPVIELSAVR